MVTKVHPRMISGVSANVISFGAVGDGVTDDTAAIQAAIDSVTGTVGRIHDDITVGGRVYFPAGIYLISSPIRVYSGQIIEGDGPVSNIKSSAGFVGAGSTIDALMVLTEVGTGGGQKRVDGTTINNLEFDSTATAGDQAAITFSSISGFILVNDIFTNLYFNTEFGLMLGVYCQSCILDNIYSYGAIEQVLHMSGNHNIVRNIDKEVGSGTSTDPYVLFDDLGTGAPCSGNLVERVLLEGTGSANKAAVRFTDCGDMILDQTWFELSASTGNVIEFINLDGQTVLRGKYNAALDEKLLITNCRSVYIEQINVDTGLNTLEEFITVDEFSNVVIGNIISRKAENSFNLGRPNVKVLYDQSRTGVGEADPGKVNMYFGFNSSGNLLRNPSFEAGVYGWSWASGPDTTDEYIQSEIGDGLMGHYVWSADTSAARIQQNINVPTEWVGEYMTVCLKVKIVGGDETDLVSVRIGNTGLNENTQYFPRVTGRDENWHLLSFTFAHQNLSATAQIGFRCQIHAGVHLYIDEASLTFGSEGVPNMSNMRSVQMNGRMITTGLAAPTTGTHVVGSIVFNEGAAAAGTVGWVCTTAGTPGTWKTFGTIAA